MSTQTPVAKDHPLMVAWEKYKATEDYANSKKWAVFGEHVDGSLWALFVAGWDAAGGLNGALASSPSQPADAEFKRGWAAACNRMAERLDRQLIPPSSDIAYSMCKAEADRAPAAAAPALGEGER